MAKQFLSLEEIRTLNRLLRQIFEYITYLKDKNPLAGKIKYPQLPSNATESLALHLLRKRIILKELSSYHFAFGGSTSDILAESGGKKVRIEVKATARSAFQYFGPRDIRADYIIWIHFGQYFMKAEETPLQVITIRSPGTHFSRPVKITLSKLRQSVPDVVEKEIDLRTL